MRIGRAGTFWMFLLAVAVNPVLAQAGADAKTVASAEKGSTTHDPAAAAQAPEAPYTIRTDVPLVVLDLVVTDRKGQAVRNLTQKDFHVQESGEPQSILSFSQAGAQVQPSAVTIHSTAELDRLAPDAPVQILVLDEFNTRFEDMAFARYSLKKILQREPEKLSTPTMLISVNLQRLTVIQDYTQDKQTLIRALDHHLVAYPWQLKSGGWEAERYATAFETLRRVALAAMGHPGHKTMIWIGRGFPALDWSAMPVDTQQLVDSAVQSTINTLRDARVTLYTVDPAGILIDPTAAYGEAAALDDPMGGNYQFSSLAKATGGAALFGRNDVDHEIGTAIQDGSNFYTITYRPTNSLVDPQRFRKITVQVDQPGVSVLTRNGYYLSYDPPPLEPSKPSPRIAADLLEADESTMNYDGVPFTVEEVAGDPGKWLIHLGAEGLYWSKESDGAPWRTNFALVVSSFDSKGKELSRQAALYRIPATGDIPPTGVSGQGLDIRYITQPNPKAVRMRFTVRMTATGRIGATNAMLKPPTR